MELKDRQCFYELQKATLTSYQKLHLTLFTCAKPLETYWKVDPLKVEDKPIILRKFSKNNIENMQGMGPRVY